MRSRSVCASSRNRHISPRVARPDISASLDANRLLQRIPGKHAWAGADDDDVRRIVDRKRLADAKRRLDVRMRDHGAAAAPFEDELELRGSTDDARRALVPVAQPFRARCRIQIATTEDTGDTGHCATGTSARRATSRSEEHTSELQSR